MSESLEKNIKKQLQNHEMSPPPMAWEHISNELHKKEEKRGFAWANWMNVAAILIPAFLVTSVLLLNNYKSTKNTPNLTKSSHRSNHENVVNDNAKTQNNHLTNDVLVEITNETNTQNSLASSKKDNNVIHFIKGIFHKDKAINNTQYATTSDNSLNKKVSIFDFLTSPFQSDIKSKLPNNTLYAYASPIEESLTFDLLDELDNKTKIEEEEIPKDRFELSPYGGIAMLGSFDNKSLIAPEFNQLSVDNELSTTYGAKASYILNDRLKVKSGVGVINMTQNTYDVPLFVGNNLNSSYNKNYNLKTNISNANIHLGTNNTSLEGSSNYLKENISQEVQFIEVPLEVEYKLAGNKKIQLNASTGVSSLIVNKNSIYLKDDNIEFAKATNINDVSFSANAGVKLEYNITEKVSANVEPQFKYYINAITDNKDIKPYTLGVNAGLSYSL